MTIAKQIAQVQVLKSLMWIKCFGSSENRDNCEVLREGFPEEEEFVLGYEKCLGWYKKRRGRQRDVLKWVESRLYACSWRMQYA